MSEALLKSYIAGQWVLPGEAGGIFEAINPANEEVCARIALCGPAEADAAVRAARAAFPAWSVTPLAERMEAVERSV
jgi:aldehyde dehydrogenase (NAD+)